MNTTTPYLTRPFAGVEEYQEVIDLALAQEARQQVTTAHLRAARSREELEAVFVQDAHLPPQVVLDTSGRVRGYAQPAVWELKKENLLNAFFTHRNGIIRNLILPDPTEAEAVMVTTTLLDALSVWWAGKHTSGELIYWPSGDTWLQAVVAMRGWQLDSICAFRSLKPFFASQPDVPSSLHFREAQPEDEEALVRLFEEELLFHERCTPFVRSSPSVLLAFRQKLARLWNGEGLGDGAPVVLVAEHGRELVAMAESTLLVVEEDEDQGLTPPGRYWCINNVSVHEKFHRQGIGRGLVQMIERTRLALRLDLQGYLLWYNPDNPKASHFWPQLGFQPLWTTYQRCASRYGSESE